MTIELARRNALEVLHDIAEGKNPAEVKRGQKVELTFSDLFRRISGTSLKAEQKNMGERIYLCIEPILLIH